MRPVPFAQQSYLDSSKDVSVQRLVNLYLQPKDAQSKSRTALHATPGLKLWSTIGSGPCRGIIGMGSYLYVVSGNEVYSVDVNKVATLLGSIAGNGAVGLAKNGTHVAITTNGANIYAVNSSSFNTLSVTSAQGVAFQDGYLCYAERGSQKFFISGLNNALTYDALDFTQVNAQPDLNTGIANANRETWVFNERSAQVYYNSGAADFPFALNPSGVVERGCVAPRSIVSYQGSVAWLGDDLRVYVSQGYTPRAVSTAPIDDAIGKLASPESATAFAYSKFGHIFYVITFPSQATYVYDFTTGAWHERQSYNRSDWRARGHEYWFSRHLVGDAVNGKIYELDHDTFDEDGTVILRKMTSPPIHGGRQRLFFGRLELDMENGVGVEGSGQGSDPQVMLRWTDDGGRTYSNEMWKKLGKGGKYKWRTSWNRLGSAFERSYELSMSDPVKFVLIEAYHDVSAGGGR